jgi:hypothetical protein
MKRDQLDADTESKVEEFLRALADDLNRTSSPHLTAATVSWSDDTSVAVNGGGLRAPTKPPFNTKAGALSARHRTVLEAGDKNLYAFLVRASRPDTQSAWQLDPVFVSRADYRALVLARKPIDDQIEAKLRQIVGSSRWERVTFGRLSEWSDASSLSIKRAGTLEKSAAPPELLPLLAQTVAEYKQAGLNLLTADWTLRSSEFRFKDYFE